MNILKRKVQSEVSPLTLQMRTNFPVLQRLVTDCCIRLAAIVINAALTVDLSKVASCHCDGTVLNKGNKRES